MRTTSKISTVCWGRNAALLHAQSHVRAHRASFRLLLALPVSFHFHNVLELAHAAVHGFTSREWHASTPGSRGVRRGAGEFTNSSMGGKFVSAAGAWLSNPVAVLRATDDTGNQTSALLKLSDPHFNATQRTLTFKVRPECSIMHTPCHST